MFSTSMGPGDCGGGVGTLCVELWSLKVLELDFKDPFIIDSAVSTFSIKNLKGLCECAVLLDCCEMFDECFPSISVAPIFKILYAFLSVRLSLTFRGPEPESQGALEYSLAALFNLSNCWLLMVQIF